MPARSLPPLSLPLSYARHGRISSTLTLLLLLWSSLSPKPGIAAQILTDAVALNCTQTESQLLACSYRLLNSAGPSTVEAVVGNKALEVTAASQYPAADSITAVLLVVDTSDPGRQDVINKNATQIARILEKTGSHHRVGLANFDKELVVNVPVGGTANDIIAAAQSLKAVGMTTELYRSTIRAIEALAQTAADRKVLVLMSDGQAEDRAYFHEDVVRTAIKHGVIINSLGFPRSTPLSVALQTLRRLSEETGGSYIETDNSYELPATYMQAPFANIDRGGKFIIDLTPLESIQPVPQTVQVRFAGTGIAVPVPVTINEVIKPAPTSVVIAAPVTPSVDSTPLPSAPVPGLTESSLVDTLLWYGLPVALIILSLMTLFTLILLYRRQGVPAARTVSIVTELHKPQAYLISEDDSRKRFPISNATCRIGRSRDNDMTLNDNSVSRKHAEIRRNFKGQFVLYDRDSSNGVYVNKRKIREHKLVEGDIIEIGDVMLRFTQEPPYPASVTALH